MTKIFRTSCFRKIGYCSFVAATAISLWACASSKSTSSTPTTVLGLTTATSLITQVITPASVRDTVDSLETALIAIRLSNTTLLHTPLSENCRWPIELSKAPSNQMLVKMGVSGALMSQGKSAAFEIDKRTGLPRPTSPLYLMLKDKEKVLKRAKRPNQKCYRNALRAFGVVSMDNDDIAALERALVANEKGQQKCQGLIGANNKTFQKGIKEKYCESKALKVVKLDDQSEASKIERDDAKKQFAPLARNVFRVTLANLDYMGAAMAQMTGSILKMSSAIKNAKTEFKQLRPREVAMMVSRLENIKQIAPFFPQYMSDQITIYKKIYSVLKEDYDDLLDEDEKKTAQLILDRIETLEIAYAGVRDKIAALARNENVSFSDEEKDTWNRLSALYQTEYPPPDKINAMSQEIAIIANGTDKNLLAQKEMRP